MDEACSLVRRTLAAQAPVNLLVALEHRTAVGTVVKDAFQLALYVGYAEQVWQAGVDEKRKPFQDSELSDEMAFLYVVKKIAVRI